MSPPSPQRWSRAASGIVLIAAASLSVGLFTWFSSSLLVPLAYEGRPPEYVFLGAPPARSIAAALVAGLALWVLHARSVPRTQDSHWSAGSLAYLTPLIGLAAAPLGAAILLSGGDERLTPFTYVVVDLRWWWSIGLVAVTAVRFERRRGDAWRRAGAERVRRWTPAARLFTLDAALLLLLLVVAVVASRQLRFSAVLHGDEPKYLRLCENLYQGLGLDVAHQRTMDELTLAFSPPLWRNVVLFGDAVREDAGYLVTDGRLLLSRGRSAKYNRAQFVEGWFVHGRNGGFYQVHNPGLSLILCPAYFVDRHVLSTSAGYQGVFPTRLAVTNLLLLMLWAIWGVTVFRLLRAALQRDGLAWLLAATAMLTMPVAAFAFQIYPETCAGIIVTTVCTWLLFKAPDASRRRAALLAGAAVGALPWLHVRFLVTSLVLAGWGLVMLRRRRTPFVAGYAVMGVALCLYAYHLTGSLRPDAMYESEGSAAPWRLADALQSMLSFPFDRIWGFLPHAPVYLLAIPGWMWLARAQRQTAMLLGLLIASLVLAASGHGFTGAGATPLRFLVAVVPLAMVAVGQTLIVAGRSRAVRAAFLILLALSLHAALAYNWHHAKEVGRMVVQATSGWTPNLLFPWTHGQPWANWRGTYLLLILWMITTLLLMAAPLLWRRRLPAAAHGVPAIAPRPLTLPFMAGATALFVLLATGATALGGEWKRDDYLPPLGVSRQRTIAYGLDLARCQACYSSLRGQVGRGNLVEDTRQTFAFVPIADDVRVGEEMAIAAMADAKDGADYGTLAIDFGDSRVSRVELRGRVEVRHAYQGPGLYQVTARFAPHGAAVQHRTVSVAVRPASLEMTDVDGLPDAVRQAAVHGTIDRLALGPDGLTARLIDGSSPSSIWLLTWSDGRWHARPGAAAASLTPGWVTALAADPQGRWRTTPVTVRWPSPSLVIGAAAVIYP